ncbi:MAG TPA: hypothetical protein VGB67_07995 [Fibrella sp.]|jgi:hypothetical protein
MDNQNPPEIVQTPITEAERMNVTYPDNGEVVTNVLGTETGEVVVHDYNEAGEVIGWHKEARS